MIILLREVCVLLCNNGIWLLLAANELDTSIGTQTGPQKETTYFRYWERTKGVVQTGWWLEEENKGQKDRNS